MRRYGVYLDEELIYVVFSVVISDSGEIDIDKANPTRFPLHRHSQMIPFTGPATNEEVTPVRESGQYIKAQTPAELI